MSTKVSAAAGGRRHRYGVPGELTTHGSRLRYWTYEPQPAEARPPEPGPAEHEPAEHKQADANPAEPGSAKLMPTESAPAKNSSTVDERPVLVFVHGFRGTHHGLAGIAAALPEYRVVAPDLPGFGTSAPMTERDHDVAGYAAAVTDLLDVVRAGHSRIALLGHSFGSVIAARIAATRPDLVDELILVNPIASDPVNGFTGAVATAYYGIGRALPKPIGRALLSSRAMVWGVSVAMARTNDRRLRQWIHRQHFRYFSQFRGVEVLYQAFRASISGTVREYADQLRMPTLVIAGERDDIAPLPSQREFAAEIGARLRIIDSVGHLVHYETPADAAEAIREFLGPHDSTTDALESAPIVQLGNSYPEEIGA